MIYTEPLSPEVARALLGEEYDDSLKYVLNSSMDKFVISGFTQDGLLKYEYECEQEEGFTQAPPLLKREYTTSLAVPKFVSTTLTIAATLLIVGTGGVVLWVLNFLPHT